MTNQELIDYWEKSAKDALDTYDDYKNQFYKKATPEYADKWLKVGMDIFKEMEAMV